MDANNNSFVVMVWVKLSDEKGDTMRVVKSYNTAKLMAQAANALGLRAGIDHNFTGNKMSTPAQVRRGYAILRSKGYTLRA